MHNRFLSLLLCSTLAPAATAQPPGAAGQNPQQPRQPEIQHIEMDGRIHSLAAKQINVVTADNQPWQVQLADNTMVTVKGEAGPEALRPRMPVRFYARLNKRGLAIEPVSEMTAFTPHEGFAPVVELVTEAEAKGEAPGDEVAPEEGEPADPQADAPAPEQQQQEDINPRLSNRRNGASGRRNQSAAEPEAADFYFVTAILMNVRKGKFVANVGELGNVKGSLAPDASVKFDFDNHLAARPGDMIHFKATSREPGLAMAQVVAITLSPPEEKQPQREPRASNREREVGEQPPPREGERRDAAATQREPGAEQP